METASINVPLSLTGYISYLLMASDWFADKANLYDCQPLNQAWTTELFLRDKIWAPYLAGAGHRRRDRGTILVWFKTRASDKAYICTKATSCLRTSGPM